MIYFKHIFHCRYKSSTFFGRNLSVFFQMRLTFNFFNIRCTVMCETDDVKSSSTAFSASNLTVQRRYPFGASEQAKATSCASNVPSKIISRGGLVRDLRTRAASSPQSHYYISRSFLYHVGDRETRHP